MVCLTKWDIGTNRENPGKFFYDNAIMGIQLFEYARQFGVKNLFVSGRFVPTQSTPPSLLKKRIYGMAIPKRLTHHTVYGLAKKMPLVQLKAYRQQYGFNGIYLLPVNLYGLGDNPSATRRTGFDPKSSHVIPALIKKCADAVREGKDEIVVWGTGEVTREFIYVGDAAEGILLATEKYDKPEPVNPSTDPSLRSGLRLRTKYWSGVFRPRRIRLWRRD